MTRRSTKQPRGGALSPQQRDIVQMTWDRLAEKQIAACMGLSLTTLKGYKANIFRKWGVHSTVEMIREASERGIVRPTTYRQQFCDEEWPGVPEERGCRYCQGGIDEC